MRLTPDSRRAGLLRAPAALAGLVVSVSLIACGGDSNNGSDGPTSSEAPVVHATGNNANGQQVFDSRHRGWPEGVSEPGPGLGEICVLGTPCS